MAVDIFIKLDPVKGEAQDSKHKDEIDVLAYSWGMSQSASTHLGTGSGSGKANIQDLNFTKYIDKSSSELVKCCVTGKHIAKGLLTVRKAGEKPLEYLKMDIHDIIVTHVSTGGSGGEDRLTENVTLNFAKFKVTYTQQNKDGSAGTSASWGWDIQKNEEAK